MPDGYGQRFRGAVFAEHPVALKESFKDWASVDTGTTVLGVATGVAVGEYVGTWVTGYFKIDKDWTGVLAKAAVKAGLSFALFMIGGKTKGIAKVFLNGASVGCLASIIGDVVGQVAKKPAFGMISNPSVQGVNIMVNRAGSGVPVGSRSQVISSI
jgi:hypothetical protein